MLPSSCRDLSLSISTWPHCNYFLDWGTVVDQTISRNPHSVWASRCHDRRPGHCGRRCFGGIYWSWDPGFAFDISLCDVGSRCFSSIQNHVSGNRSTRNYVTRHNTFRPAVSDKLVIFPVTVYHVRLGEFYFILSKSWYWPHMDISR